MSDTSACFTKATRAVRSLSRELFDIGVAEARKSGINMRGWDTLSPHVVAGHDAVAAYVLKHFVRRSNKTIKKGGAS